MGPDLFWVAVFALGGVAIGLVTTFVGLRKGRELWHWLGLFTFMLAAVVVLDIDHPFWTVLCGSLAAGLAAGCIQAGLVGRYRRHNPWFDPGTNRSGRSVAGGLLVFSTSIGALFGLVLGGLAWALQSLLD